MKSFQPYILLLTVIVVLAPRYYSKYVEWKNLEVGVIANVERERLKIPTIEDGMRPESFMNTGKLFWESKRTLPKGDETLHVWKKVSIGRNTRGLRSEADAYRKKVSEDKYQQFNLYTLINKDSTTTRRGSLFLFGDKEGRVLHLGETSSDSLLLLWGVDELAMN